MAKKEKQKHYTDDFKRDAVRLMENRGKSTIMQVADDLGINDRLLYHWVKQFGTKSTAVPNEQVESLEQEVRRLRRETEQLRIDKAILKKAAVLSTRHGNARVGSVPELRGLKCSDCGEV